MLLVIRVLLVVAFVEDVHEHVGELSLGANEVVEVILQEVRGVRGGRAGGHCKR